MSGSDTSLGLKFADRTFRFVRLAATEDGPQLTAAGAGLIPFDAKSRGQMHPDGSDRLIDTLGRSLDRAGVDRGPVVVVLDGRSVLRTVFPITEETASDADRLEERCRWELDQRRADGGDPQALHIEYTLRGRRGEWILADVWGAYPETLSGYDAVVQGTGCTVERWECDAWSMHRLYENYVPAGERESLTAAVHLEAESMEVLLADAAGSVGITLPRAESAGAFLRSWDPDDVEAVAREVAWGVGQLRDRWLPGARPEQAQVARLIVTGSIDEPDRLVGAFTRALPLRVELLELRSILGMSDKVADSPMVRGNLGAFALAAGGALSRLTA